MQEFDDEQRGVSDMKENNTIFNKIVFGLEIAFVFIIPFGIYIFTT
jgi:hypothetical protein